MHSILLVLISQASNKALAQLIVPIEGLRYAYVVAGPPMPDNCVGGGLPIEQSRGFEPFNVALATTMACDSGEGTGASSQISSIGEDAIRIRTMASKRFSSYVSIGQPDGRIRSVCDFEFELTRRALFRLESRAAATFHAMPWGAINGEVRAHSLLLSENVEYQAFAGLTDPDSERVSRLELVWLEPGRYQAFVMSEIEIHLAFPIEPMGSQDYAAWCSLILEHVPCAGDLNADQVVYVSDLTQMLVAVGQQVYPPGTGADLDRDEFVTIEDLAVVLSSFGTTCDGSP
jgi:hypothetical protein